MKITDSTLELHDTPWRLFEPNKNKEWCVLWLQGFSSTIEGHSEGVVRMAEATATSFAMLNYAGHGNHPIVLEDASRQQQLDEVIGVYDELIKLGFKKVIVIGGSFGGYLAALLIGRRKAEAVILRAPANYADEEFDLPYGDTLEGQKDEKRFAYRRSIDEKYMNSAVKSVQDFTGPAYIIEHEKDETIPSSLSRSYYNAAKHGNHIIIPGLKHSPKLMANPGGYFALIELWLSTIVNATKRSQDLGD